MNFSIICPSAPWNALDFIMHVNSVLLLVCVVVGFFSSFLDPVQQMKLFFFFPLVQPLMAFHLFFCSFPLHRISVHLACLSALVTFCHLGAVCFVFVLLYPRFFSVLCHTYNCFFPFCLSFPFLPFPSIPFPFPFSPFSRPFVYLIHFYTLPASFYCFDLLVKFSSRAVVGLKGARCC